MFRRGPRVLRGPAAFCATRRNCRRSSANPAAALRYIALLPFSVMVTTTGLIAFRRLAQIFGAIFKFGEMVQKNEIDFPDGAIPLFGYKQLRHAAQIFAVALVHFFSKNKRDEIGILLNRA